MNATATRHVEFSVSRVNPATRTEQNLPAAHFTAGVPPWPGEEQARAAAISVARKLREIEPRSRFVVRRTETEIIWDGEA